MPNKRTKKQQQKQRPKKDQFADATDLSKPKPLRSSKKVGDKRPLDKSRVIHEEESDESKVYLNVQTQLDQVEEDQSWVPPTDPLTTTPKDEEISKKIRSSVSKEFQDYVIAIAPKFDIQYQNLKLNEQDWHQKLPVGDQRQLKQWYKNKYKYQKKLQSPPAITSTLSFSITGEPDEIMMTLVNPKLSSAEKGYLADVLSQSLKEQYKEYFTSQRLSHLIKEISSCKSMDNLKKLLLESPKSLRLKATAKAIVTLSKKPEFSDGDMKEGYYIAWFNHCIRPALSVFNEQTVFTKEEVEAIMKVCEHVGIKNLIGEEAIAYIQILRHHQLEYWDYLLKHFGSRDDNFWNLALSHIDLNEKVRELIVKNRFTMLTQDLIDYHNNYSIDEGFAKKLSYFKTMDMGQLIEFTKLCQNPNLEIFIDLLDKTQKHDFNLFANAVASYIQLEDKQQIQSCIINLKGKPLDKWQNYVNVVMASGNFVEQDTALTIVQKQFKELYDCSKLQPPVESERQKLSALFDEVFQRMSENLILEKFKWQEELVINIVHILINLKHTNIIVSLGTGHGKSVVIQAIAEMLVILDGPSNIVTLSNFLSYWAKNIYGRTSMLNNKINYLSIENVLQKTPSPKTHMVFDEIDSMVGSNSFYIQDYEENKIRCKYTGAQIKGWKSFIGFSGTLSNSTLLQLKAEFGDPICINIPSLRSQGLDNKLAKIFDITESLMDFTISNRLLELKEKVNNFIVIFENKARAEQFNLSQDFQSVLQPLGKKLYKLFEFSKDYSSIESDLKSLTEDNFLIITTKEGARGIDYKGLTVAHVLICFTPKTYSECVQALGRGCRDLKSYCEGTMIVSNPITTDPIKFIQRLNTDDFEHADALQLNSKVARMLNNKVYDKYDLQGVKSITQELEEREIPHLTCIMFQSHMSENKDFTKHDHEQKLWKWIRKLDTTKKMPYSCFEDWEED